MSRYDPQALKSSAVRRQKNILAFQETIKKEQAFVDHFEYVTSQIDPDHEDVKKLRSTIKKKRKNIKIFKQAIRDEKIKIREELKLATSN